MKTIIAGSRSIVDKWVVADAVVASSFDITEVVSGGARGVDTIGEHLAKTFRVPVRVFKADWKGLGRGAGIQRNLEMAAYASQLIAVWDGESRGTKHMIEEARKRGLRVFVWSPR